MHQKIKTWNPLFRNISIESKYGWQISKEGFEYQCFQVQTIFIENLF